MGACKRLRGRLTFEKRQRRSHIPSVKLSAVSKLTVSPRARMDAKEAQVREKLEDCLRQATELTGRAGNTVSSLVQLAEVLINAIRLTSNHAKQSPEVSAGV